MWNCVVDCRPNRDWEIRWQRSAMRDGFAAAMFGVMIIAGGLCPGAVVDGTETMSTIGPVDGCEFETSLATRIGGLSRTLLTCVVFPGHLSLVCAAEDGGDTSS